jgi:hypothetical protein
MGRNKPGFATKFYECFLRFLTLIQVAGFLYSLRKEKSMMPLVPMLMVGSWIATLVMVGFSDG